MIRPWVTISTISTRESAHLFTQMRSSSTITPIVMLLLHLVVKAESSPLTVPRKIDCDTDARWQLTAEAWEDAAVDKNLASWWKKTRKADPASDFATELASQFGTKSLGFNCSIDSPQTCPVPGCQPYVDNGDAPWTFLALNAVVNLNAYFNRIYEGTKVGQEDFSDKAGSIALTFFPWEDASFKADDAAIWVGATIGAIFSFISIASRAATAGAAAIASFISAGTSQLQLGLNPDPELTVTQGLSAMTEAASTSVQQWRGVIEDWDSTLFSGNVDSQNHTILDYLEGGALVSLELPEAEAFEQYWLQSLISRTINAQWRTRANFVTFAYTDDADIDIGPNVSKYYSAEDRGVYYLYQWRASKSRLDEPDGMDQLEAVAGGILPSEVTQSSAASFKLIGYNSDDSDALQSSFQSALFQTNASYFTDGAAAPLFWTIPVCNMTEFWRWNGQYDESSLAPCCCGDNCTDTDAFASAANLGWHKSYTSQCSNQLKQAGLCAKIYGRYRGAC
jgi:hypothetical protein